MHRPVRPRALRPRARLALVAKLVLSLAAPTAAESAAAQRAEAQRPATRAAYVDAEGVIRWRDTREEVALFGANYTLPSASDYRAAGYLTRDRKRLIDEDMAHFARMGWDGVRVALWGDWENTDRAGNLVADEHLDLADYLIAKARERGIYVLLNPIHVHNANWPDALQAPVPGFAGRFQKSEYGTSDSAIAVQANYLRQLMRHVNPYTGVALKDEPSILLVEMINEPWHHSRDVAGSVRYIDALAEAVRSTGGGARDKILFHNVSQDFAIAESIRRSTVPGGTFGWYPSGLNAGRELRGNYLRTVDDYPGMRLPELARRPRAVYEFDAADLLTGYMYPAMVRTFRAGGVQFASMFAYDMLRTASRNLGWQTHYLNLVYTPRKAMSAVIAAEAMRGLPRGRAWGAYPRNTRFGAAGEFRVSYEENLAEMVTAEAFLHAGTTRTAPPDRRRLARVAGYGSSPVVTYEGEGVYFLDRVRDGVWRLEVYPDAVPVRDPFEMQRPDKVVTRAIWRAWPMTVDLPDLGATFSVAPVTAGGTPAATAQAGRFTVTPGVYVLSARGAVDRRTLPATVGRVRFDEFIAPPPDTVPVAVLPAAAPEYLAGRSVEIAARVVDATPPDAVTLWVRQLGTGRLRPFPMRAAGGYDWRVALPPDALREGAYEYAVSVTRRDSTTTFPEGTPRRPSDWDYSGERYWRLHVVRPETPLRLLSPAEDVPRLAFTRVGDAGRQGIFRVVPSSATGAPAIHLERPLINGWVPEDYTAGLFVGDRVASRGEAIAGAKRLTLRARGLGTTQVLHVTLVEKDGTSWTAPITVDGAWGERSVALSDLTVGRGVMLPNGYPGSWNYWILPAAGRGGPGDGVRIAEVERLQLSLRRDGGGGAPPPAGAYGVEVEWVTLTFR